MIFLKPRKSFVFYLNVRGCLNKINPFFKYGCSQKEFNLQRLALISIIQSKTKNNRRKPSYNSMGLSLMIAVETGCAFKGSLEFKPKSPILILTLLNAITLKEIKEQNVDWKVGAKQNMMLHHIYIASHMIHNR